MHYKTLIIATLMLVFFSGCISVENKANPRAISTADSTTTVAPPTIKTGEYEESENESVGENTPTSTMRTAITDAVTYPETAVCLDTTDAFMAGECLRALAREKGDYEVCELISDSQALAGCLRDVALEANDAAGCERIGDAGQRDACLMTVALNSANESVCGKISSENARYKCLAHTNVSPAYCDRIGDAPTHDWCLYSLAKKMRNSLVCDGVIDAKVRDTCYLDYVRDNRLDATVCNRIADDSMWKQCTDVAVTLTCPVEHFMPKYGKPIEPRQKS